MSGTFFIVTTEEGDALAIKWAEARDEAKHPTVYKAATQHQQRII